jgi:hypothetical protein
MEVPALDSLWEHKSGRVYQVILLANMSSDEEVRYPKTVVYKDLNSKIWSRPLSRWHESMTEL